MTTKAEKLEASLKQTHHLIELSVKKVELLKKLAVALDVDLQLELAGKSRDDVDGYIRASQRMSMFQIKARHITGETVIGVRLNDGSELMFKRAERPPLVVSG